MKTVKVSLRNRTYRILIGDGLIENIPSFLKNSIPRKDAYVITNKLLYRIYGNRLKEAFGKSGRTIRFDLVPDSEKSKSIKTAAMVLSRLSRYDAGKEIFIVAFGGGVIGDLAGFIASIYKRGVPYIQIPTTLLAQVDSSIGGKVALDLPIAKNMVGSFYQPRMVISDTSVLTSLPLRQLRNGLAEVIKYGIIKDRRLFIYLEKNFKKILKFEKKSLEHVILSSSKIKAYVISKDEFDKKDIRAILNYGHTIGHAIESSAGYSKAYYHGEAISIGMLIAAFISYKMRLLSYKNYNRVESLIKNTGLPYRIKKVTISKILQSYLHDKKFIGGKNKFILIKDIGKAFCFKGVPEKVIKSAVEYYSS